MTEKIVKELADRLAATDGFNPESLTLTGAPVKGNLFVIYENMTPVPAWQRYEATARAIVEMVRNDNGHGWIPIADIDPEKTPSVAMWMVDENFEYLLKDVRYDGSQWIALDHSYGENGYPLGLLDGNPTHYRLHPTKPIDGPKNPA